MESSTLLRLLETSLVVARLGERDVHGWWATDGVLGEDGAFVGPRVLPKTHPAARARIVFAVAAHASIERHPDRAARSLFRLGPESMDRLDALLVDRLADHEWWGGWMDRLRAVQKAMPVAEVLTGLGVVTQADLAQVARLSMGPDGRSLSLPQPADPAAAIRVMAAGFIRSKPGELAVPCLPAGTELLS